MTVAALVLSAHNRVERLFDLARRERTIVAALPSYFAVRSLYSTIAEGSQDIHTDTGEFVAWSRDSLSGSAARSPPKPAEYMV
jgi:hypothetical protein